MRTPDLTAKTLPGANGLVKEGVLVTVMLGIAVSSGSLTFLSVTLLSLVNLINALSRRVILDRMQRGDLENYEFGIGKLHRASDLVVAFMMVVAGLWIVAHMLALATTADSPSGPLGLAVAATANAVMILRRGFQIGRLDATAAARFKVHHLVPLIVAQVAMTLAAAAQDPSTAVLAELFGAGFIALTMLVSGARQSYLVTLELIDHPLDSKNQALVANLALEYGFKAEEVHDLRARRSGNDTFVELTLCPTESGSLEEMRERIINLRHALSEHLAGLDMSVRLRPSDEI